MFAPDTYAVLQELLAGQIQAESSEEFVERVSIPGVLIGRTVKLFSGQVVPLQAPQNPRGMYGSKIETLVSAAIETLQTSVGDAEEDAIRGRAGQFPQRDLLRLTESRHHVSGEGAQLCGDECLPGDFHLCRSGSNWDGTRQHYGGEKPLLSLG